MCICLVSVGRWENQDTEHGRMDTVTYDSMNRGEVPNTLLTCLYVTSQELAFLLICSDKQQTRG